MKIPFLNFRSDNKEEILSKALTCKGWSTHAQLSHLYDLLISTKSIKGGVLEIGSAWGRSLVMMGLCSSKELFSIDPHTGGIAFINRNENQNSFEIFNENLQKFNLSQRVHVFKNTTQEVIDGKLLDDKIKFSFAFIDGLHTAEGVKTDIEFTIPRMLPGGIVVFDDYFKPSVKDMSDMIDTMAVKLNLTLIKKKEYDLVYFEL